MLKRSEYVVELYDADGSFRSKIDVFATEQEAKTFIHEHPYPNPYDNVYYRILRIDYEDDKEIGVEKVFQGIRIMSTEEREERRASYIKDIMKDRLEYFGYDPTEQQLTELLEIYEDCQEWDEDGEEMLTGESYDEVEDFIRHSSTVNEVMN